MFILSHFVIHDDDEASAGAKYGRPLRLWMRNDTFYKGFYKTSAQPPERAVPKDLKVVARETPENYSKISMCFPRSEHDKKSWRVQSYYCNYV